MIRNTFPLDRTFNRQQFSLFLREFLPDDFTPANRSLSLPFQPKFITEGELLGTCRSLELEIFLVNHTSAHDARVGISKELFRILCANSMYNRALVVTIPEGASNWRLSLLQMEISQDDNSARVRYEYSNPRRHSFMLGEGAKIKTPEKFLFEMGEVHERIENRKQLTEWEDLESRFSVESLTKEFYEKLYDWYLWAVDKNTNVYFPNNVDTTEDDQDNMNVKIIRLITRMLFVWFIKQKGLVPDDIFDTDRLKEILADFDETSSSDGLYYNAILQNLFFATLNNEIDKRKFVTPYHGRTPHRGVKTLFRDDDKHSFYNVSHNEVLTLFSSVPYMNCGLFECLDKYKDSDINTDHDMFYDGFSTSSKRDKATGRYLNRAFVPNTLFFADKHTETVHVETKNGKTHSIETKTIEVQGLLRLFYEFNFTVEENTPSDIQVSLDPELLGRVFENLLAAYNPATQKNARKSTGSFYTPRPIVEYMVNETLVQYLKTKVVGGEQLEPELRKLIGYKEEEINIPEVQCRDILHCLYTCKILDPACGSGAFPMGMLQQMVHIMKRIDPENYIWHDVVLEEAAHETMNVLKNEMDKDARHQRMQEIEQDFEDDLTNADYKRKLYIIRNCIYGVDIQPIAMLISKLRFFISLICEQEVDVMHPENNYGIHTLPGLETKFVAANSLLPASIRNSKKDLFSDEHLLKLKDDLLAIRKEHFMAKTSKSRQNNRDKDRKKCKEIHDYIMDVATKPDEELIAKYKRDIEQNKRSLQLYEGEKWREDKMPVQTSLFDPTPKPVIRRFDYNKYMREEILKCISFAEAAIKKEEEKKDSNKIPVFEQSVRQLTDWNPYDQINYSPYFDAEWMFGVTHGFDIVIGNPPYGASVSDDEKGLYKEYYKSAKTENGIKGSTDTFCVFTEKGFNETCHNGVLSYIVPMSITSSDAMEQLHTLLAANCEYLRVSSYSNRPKQIFESAGLRTSIIQFQKTGTQMKHLYTSKLVRRRATDSIQDLLKNLSFADTLRFKMVGRYPKAGSQIECMVLSKLFSTDKSFLSFEDINGAPVYYRSAGGRYFNVITDYTTNTSAEKSISVSYARQIGLCLSSSLFWFYQQIYTDGLNLKQSELELFPLPDFSKLDENTLKEMDELYGEYLDDIEAKANVRTASGQSSYNVSQFKEYKIVRSLDLIRKIDDLVCPLYGLNKDETEFIKNYEMEFRTAGDE